MAEENLSVKVLPEAGLPAAIEEKAIYVAPPLQLMWWRFRKHKLALISAVVIGFFYLIALFPGFFSASDPVDSAAKFGLIPPQSIHWFDEGRISPHVFGLEGKRDPQTFKKVWVTDPENKIPVKFFVKGYKYKILGLISSTIHLVGIDPEYTGSDMRVFLIGTDEQGRDLWSRLMYATQISMSIGLVGVFLSLLLGIFLGGISGYYGGITDNIIQRGIEVMRSIPTIPLWMGLAAAVPQGWSILQIYLAITIILSLFSWTGLARVIRGKFLSLREEDYVSAAEIAGAGQMRIIFRHMLPSFLSHIIADLTLAIPGMIISETALSFLGLGLRPPAMSWGVLLKDAQNIQSIALSPWLLYPAIPVILVILAFNFLGDGLRDAADPYH